MLIFGLRQQRRNKLKMRDDEDNDKVGHYNYSTIINQILVTKIFLDMG